MLAYARNIAIQSKFFMRIGKNCLLTNKVIDPKIEAHYPI